MQWVERQGLGHQRMSSAPSPRAHPSVIENYRGQMELLAELRRTQDSLQQVLSLARRLDTLTPTWGLYPGDSPSRPPELQQVGFSASLRSHTNAAITSLTQPVPMLAPLVPRQPAGSQVPSISPAITPTPENVKDSPAVSLPPPPPPKEFSPTPTRVAFVPPPPPPPIPSRQTSPPFNLGQWQQPSRYAASETAHSAPSGSRPVSPSPSLLGSERPMTTDGHETAARPFTRPLPQIPR